MTVNFDALAYSGELEAEGVPPRQAAVHARALSSALKDVVCVHDLNRAEMGLRGELHDLENRLVQRIDQVRSELSSRIEAVRIELIAKIDLVRSDLSARLDALSAHVETVRSDLSARIEIVRMELLSAIADLRSDNASIHRELVIHRWMFGVIIALNGATLGIAIKGGL